MHRIYKLLDEEDNIHFMSMIDATPPVNNTTSYYKEAVYYGDPLNSAKIMDLSKRNLSNAQEMPIVSIKTETSTGYVNIDGIEREKVKNESLGDILKESMSSYYNNTSLNESEKETVTEAPETETDGKVEVDDIIVPHKLETEKLQPPSSTKAKDAMKMLPKVIQDFLNSDWKTKPKCEPQHMIERIRKEKRYPEHPDVGKYKFLLTPAPSFMQRISLAGEFLNKEQLQL